MRWLRRRQQQRHQMRRDCIIRLPLVSPANMKWKWNQMKEGSSTLADARIEWSSKRERREGEREHLSQLLFRYHSSGASPSLLLPSLALLPPISPASVREGERERTGVCL